MCEGKRDPSKTHSQYPCENDKNDGLTRVKSNQLEKFNNYQFDIAACVEQQVLWFEITVDDTSEV